MPTIETVLECDDEELTRRLAPRDDLLVAETVVDGPDLVGGAEPAAAVGRHRFECREGPFSRYVREVDVTRAGATAGGGHLVTQTISYRLAIPYWWRLYDVVVRRALPSGLRPGVTPWWCTPDRLDARRSTMVASMALFNLVAGLLYGLLTQVLTFVSADLGNGSADEQATVFAVVRVGVVITAIAMVFADRVGRRRIALWCFGLAAALTIVAAVSPSLWVLAALQLVSRNLAIAGLLCVDTIAVEELPPGSRAMVTGLGALSYGLGAGFIVVALPLADLGDWGWRLTFLVAAVTIPMILSAARHLPESGRFERFAAGRGGPEQPPTVEPDVEPAAEPTDDGVEVHTERTPGGSEVTVVTESQRIRGSRFLLIAVMFFLFNLFVAPSSQLQNDYLRAELGYTGLLIAVFTIATGTPAGLGVLLGGRLADLRGRRAAIIPGFLALAGFTALFFMTSGAPMWIAKLLAGVLGTLAVPAMGVIAPELFPTGRRGGVRGALTTVAVVGSVVGLLGAGTLVDSRGYGTAFLLLAIAPVVAAVLALAIPETRGRELEDLNR